MSSEALSSGHSKGTIESTEMLSNTSSESRTDGSRDAADRSRGFLARKIWLPKLIYDALPYFYVTAGFAALFSTLYINHWLWVVPHYLLFSAACVHLGWSVYRKRRTVPVATVEDTTGQA
ncbi:MAG: hypothetical protein AAGA44_16585 [Pseudomonadota bacterium]